MIITTAFLKSDFPVRAECPSRWKLCNPNGQRDHRQHLPILHLPAQHQNSRNNWNRCNSRVSFMDYSALILDDGFVCGNSQKAYPLSFGDVASSFLYFPNLCGDLFCFFFSHSLGVAFHDCFEAFFCVFVVGAVESTFHEVKVNSLWLQLR